jgi:predicted ATPase
LIGHDPEQFRERSEGIGLEGDRSRQEHGADGGTAEATAVGSARPGRCEDASMRIVLTGGPGGGKTTAADLFRREIGEQVVVVPESATMLFAGGFPRVGDEAARRSVQRAIFEVQRSLEDIQAALYPDRVLLCDRGTVDGAAYWPDGTAEFFAQAGTTLDAELARYDAVLHFETAAVGGSRIEGGNRWRTESDEEAIALDRRLRALWSGHPGFHLVPHHPSFLRKITIGLSILESVVATRRAG